MNRKTMVVLGVIFGGLLLTLCGFLLLAFVALKSLIAEDGGTFGSSSGPAVGILEIKGEIVGADKILKNLRRLAKDDQVKAILVRIDSPGGAVGTSQEIYSELRKLGESKKVVCSLGNLAASGGYYIAAGCQKIVASPGTLTGSIGVISQLPYLGDIAHELKFEMTTIKSGKMKDIGNPFRPMNSDERQYLQALMDNVHRQFIAAVAQGRELKEEEVLPLADGRVFTGQEAKQMHLVDELGNLNDAIKLAATMAGIEGEPRLQYPPEERQFHFEDWIKNGTRALVKGVREEMTAAAGASQVSGPAYLLPTPVP